MGWGIVVTEPVLTAPSSGVFETSKDSAHQERLMLLHGMLTDKIATEHPDVVVVERLFFNFNVQTAMNVGEGRAMVMLAAAQFEVPVVEYTALTAKLILAGHGRADRHRRDRQLHLRLPADVQWLLQLCRGPCARLPRH